MNMYTVPLSSDLNMKCLTNHEFQEVGEGLYTYNMDSSAVGLRIMYYYAYGRGHS